MNELIPLQPQTINGNAVETVSARESQHGPKQVETWRYYDCAIDRFKSILETE